MTKKITVLTLIFTLMLAATPLFAASPWTEEEGYADQTRAKLDYGLKNVMGGWTELITVPAQAEGSVEGITKGIGEGLYKAVAYTVGGALHLVTFFVPVDVEIPNNGVQFE